VSVLTDHAGARYLDHGPGTVTCPPCRGGGTVGPDHDPCHACDEAGVLPWHAFLALVEEARVRVADGWPAPGWLTEVTA
jgi:hypothetical protein